MKNNIITFEQAWDMMIPMKTTSPIWLVILFEEREKRLKKIAGGDFIATDSGAFEAWQDNHETDMEIIKHFTKGVKK